MEERARGVEASGEREGTAPMHGCVNYLRGVYLSGDLQAGSARLIYTPVRPWPR